MLLEDISIFGDVQSTYPFGISLYALDGTASITVLRLAVQNPIFSDETFFVNQVGTQPIRVEIDSAVFSNEASLDPSEHADAMSVDVVKKVKKRDAEEFLPLVGAELINAAVNGVDL